MSDVFATIERFRAAGIPAEHAIAAARVHLGAGAGGQDRPAPEVLRDLPATLAGLVTEIADAHNVTVADVMGKTRKHRVSRARNACFAAARAMGMSLPEIGALFHRDHSTVIHGLAGHRRRSATGETGQ